MIWGVFSDVHSNLEALEAVLEAFRSRDVGAYVCCGDLVGYGPEPNAVVGRVAALAPLRAVSGNHDLVVLERMDISWFNRYAQQAALWTRRILSPEARRFLADLPARVETPAFTVVHGSPRNPAEEYLLTRQQFLDNLTHFKVSPCFIGHSHMTWCFSLDGASPLGTKAQMLREGQTVQAPADVPWIVNPGSVGQPRDQDKRAACGVYDDSTREFTLLRVPYDIEAVQAKMRAVELPELLVLRLAYGQ